MDMFIQYQIPSDLMSYEGDRDVNVSMVSICLRARARVCVCAR
jgi:hypothetical protein